VLPPCASERFEPTDYFADGTNYNGQHPPAYYAAVGWYARIATEVFGIDSFVGAARSFGALTLALGMILLHRAIRSLGVSPVTAAAAALLPLTSATFVHLHSTVNNDAALLPLTAAILWSGSRAHQRRGASWVLPAVALLAGLTKLTAAFPAVAMGLVLVSIGLVGRPGARDRRLVRIGALSMAAAAIPPVVWALIDRARRSPDWINPLRGENTRPVDGNPLAEIFTDPLAVLPTARPPFIAPGISLPILDAWIWFSGWLLLIGVIGLALHRVRPFRIAGRIQLLALLAIPPTIQLLAIVTSGDYFTTVSPRYGLAMIPGVIASAAVVLDDGRRTRALLPLATSVGLLVVGAGLL
jgi:4-amino-4-deoxy-L-arabinose transferase-like glycosyltransferase